MDLLQGRCETQAISIGEVAAWFGNAMKPMPSEDQCAAFASFINGCRWPGDAPDPPNSPWHVNIVEEELDDPVDFKGACHTAKQLLECMPAILSHWESRRGSSDEQAVMKLRAALSDAIDYLEWPYGRYERQTSHKTPKPWHVYAQLIARAVIKALAEAGSARPALTRNSIVVGIVQKALIRMKFPDVDMVSRSAIGAYLTRWDKKYGLIPRGDTGLTTKRSDDLCTHVSP